MQAFLFIEEGSEDSVDHKKNHIVLIVTFTTPSCFWPYICQTIRNGHISLVTMPTKSFHVTFYIAVFAPQQGNINKKESLKHLQVAAFKSKTF